MKKNIATIALIIFGLSTVAQTNTSSILVRHDTTLLKAEESEWIVKSLIKNDPALTSEIGKPVTLIILEAIEKGKLKAIDPETNKLIPAKEIFTWKMSADTIPVYDNEGNITKYQTVRRLHSSDYLKQLRIFQDWYFDVSTGKLHCQIKWVELMEDLSTSQGIYLGRVALCRVYY
jgi:Gliding motility associated protein GldN